MATSKDIEYENDVNGNPTFIKINLEKYGADLEPFLKKIGLLLPKDAFDLECEKAHTIDEARKISIAKINSWWKK
jgi:hypothetical protein